MNDGAWSDWTQYVETFGCDEECNRSGQRTRTRMRGCNSPSPTDNFGNGCLGEDSETDQSQNCVDEDPTFTPCVPATGDWTDPIPMPLNTNEDCRDYMLHQQRTCVNSAASGSPIISNSYCGGTLTIQNTPDDERRCQNFQGITCADDTKDWKWYDCPSIVDNDNQTSWETPSTTDSYTWELIFDFGRRVDLRGFDLQYGMYDEQFSSFNDIIFYMNETLELVSDSNNDKLEYSIRGAESITGGLIRIGSNWLNLLDNPARFIRFKFTSAGQRVKVEDITFFGYDCGKMWYSDSASPIGAGQYCSLGAITPQTCPNGYSCAGGVKAPPMPCPRGSYCEPNAPNPQLCPATSPDLQKAYSDPLSTSQSECGLCSELTTFAACNEREHCYYEVDGCKEHVHLLQTSFYKFTNLQGTVDSFAVSIKNALNLLCTVEADSQAVLYGDLIMLNLFGYYRCMETWASKLGDYDWVIGVFPIDNPYVVATPRPSILSSNFTNALIENGTATASTECEYQCVTLSTTTSDKPVLGICSDGSACMALIANSGDSGSDNTSWVAAVFIAITIFLCCLLATVFIFRSYHHKQKEQIKQTNSENKGRLSETGHMDSAQAEWKNQRDAFEEIAQYENFEGEGAGVPGDVDPGSMMDIQVAEVMPEEPEFVVSRPDENIGEGESAVALDIAVPGSQKRSLKSQKNHLSSSGMGGSALSMGSDSDLLYASPKAADVEGVHSGAATGADREMAAPAIIYDPAVGRAMKKSVVDQTFPDLPGMQDSLRGLQPKSMGDLYAPGNAGPGATPGVVYVDFYSHFIMKAISYESIFSDSTRVTLSKAKDCIAELREEPLHQIDDHDSGIEHLIGKTEEELRSLLRQCPMSTVTDLDPNVDLAKLNVVDR